MDTLKIISLIFMPSSDVKTKQNRKNRKTNEFISFGHLIQGKQIFNQSIYIYKYECICGISHFDIGT